MTTAEQFAEIAAIRARLKRLEQMADGYARGSEDINARLRLASGRQPAASRHADPDEPDHERKDAVRDAARAAGFHDPNDAAAILAEEDGEPAQLVADLAASRPYLRADMNTALRAAAGREAPAPEAEPSDDPGLPIGSADAGNSGHATGGPSDMNRELRRTAHRGRFGFDPGDHWDGNV